jgi:hypothetical protein
VQVKHWRLWYVGLESFFLRSHRQLLWSGEWRIDARMNYTTSKVMMLFVCGCYESELHVRVINGVLIPTIL